MDGRELAVANQQTQAFLEISKAINRLAAAVEKLDKPMLVQTLPVSPVREGTQPQYQGQRPVSDFQ